MTNSNQVKISEIAREAAINTKDVLKKAEELGIEAVKPYDQVSEQEAGKIFDAITKKQPVSTGYVRNANPSQENTATTSQYSGPKTGYVKSKSTTGYVKSAKPVEKKVETPAVAKTEPATDKPAEKVEEKRVERPRVTREPSRRKEMSRIQPIKKKGLKIIKKRRPAPSTFGGGSHHSFGSDSVFAGVYGKLSEEARKELTSRKSGKKGTNPTVRKRNNNGEELNIFNQSFKDEGRYNPNQVAEEPKEVLLLDYRDQSLFADPEEKKTETATSKKKSTQQRPQGRNSKGGGRRKQNLAKNVKKRKRKIRNEEDEIVTSAEIPENIRVYEFAEIIKRPLSDVIKVLFNLGMMVTKNDFLDGEVIEVLSEEFEVEVTTVDITEEFNYVKDYEEVEENEADLFERAPIITIMGHVDHGKTSLLDRIRTAKVADREAGGITQHIGAYTIEHNEKPITFIDTPGHSAFSEMRKRGTKITDVVIIVVAGDDGVKPQTKEAIKFAIDAKVPIIVAMNKMDKEGANADMVKAQVAEVGLNPVDWGGDTEFISVSAKTGAGIDELLETIQIQSEVLELQANPERNAKAVVIESSVERGRGAVATIIVQNGTLKIGDSIVVGSHHGKVKMLLNDKKESIKFILPGQTGVVVGLSGVPASGSDLVATDTEKEARELAEKIKQYERNKLLSKTTKASFDELGSMIAEGRLSTLKIILKTDVHGTLEAIKTSLESLRNEEVKVSIISEGVGGITENDVVLASDSENIMIVGFNVRPTGAVKTLADKKGVKLKTYSVIYEIIDDVTNLLTGMMKPIQEDVNTGQAEIKQLFSTRDGTVAGCMVIDGIVEKGIFARLIRNGVILGDTTIHSLKRFKDEVNEVKKGYECGILLKDLNDVAEGDIIETYKKIEKQAKL